MKDDFEVFKMNKGIPMDGESLLFYRPQTKFAKVMFLHVSVILSTRRGGLSQCMPGYPPEQTPPGTRHTHPGADTPPYAVHAGRYGQQAGGIHPTGMQSSLNLKF